MDFEDKNLLDWYIKGFDDELAGRKRKMYMVLNKLELKAYDLGTLHAIIGDDLSSIDFLSDEEILKRIKNDEKDYNCA